MHATTTQDIGKETFDAIVQFYRDYYRDELGTFVQRYPKDTTNLPIEYRDLSAALPDIAEDYLTAPEVFSRHLDDALTEVDLPVDRDLAEASVKVRGLPEEYTHRPGEFSPTDEAGRYRCIRGEVSKATDVYSRMIETAFQCTQCPAVTRVSQDGDGFQEPHECTGCERQGPFTVDMERSEYVDAQALRVQTPPEVAQGAGQHIDVYVEGDVVDTAAVGDRVAVSGVIQLEQVTSGRQKTAKFEPYLQGHHIALEESDHQELDVTPEEREHIHALADGAAGDPLDAAAESLAPKLYSDEKLLQIQRMCVLAMVGGSRVEYTDGDFDRGEFHILLLGDPGTAKSKLIERVEQLGWRTVGVSGKGATEAGVTASAEQDDFGEASEWTLSAGAFVKANGGVVCIDELDDMPSDVRAAILEPMSKQTIHISKAGINTRLQARTAVVAAGNPKHGRFETKEKLAEQFDLEASLLSRFDLIYTLTDEPDREHDERVAAQITGARDAAKRQGRGLEVPNEDAERIATPVDADILRKWVALASRQPSPVFESESVKQSLQASFAELRGVNGYGDDAAVPVTFRKLEGIIRIAEAAAKLEFSEEITARHARIATEAVGQSMQDFGTDDEGTLDADIQETGNSKKDRDKRKVLAEVIQGVQRESEDNLAPYDAVVEAALEEGFGENQAEHYLQKMRNAGAVYEPDTGYLKYVGGM